tara:strand:- start:96 stop:602 length:507 start_codon:yes stop_codon:yes gene_type:complete
VYQNKDHINQKHIVTKSSDIDITDQKNLLKITRKICKLVKLGDNLFLFGELGVGKTTFARNLINQLQHLNKTNSTEVLSPTYNILNEYQINNINIKHYDLYRVKQKEELENLGLFEEKNTINIIEWPEILKYFKIKFIKFDFSYSENFENRSLIISANYSNKIVDEFK